uniref:Neur_chan_LBD domain-containing protein n=1 Tax=Rhabditophanes sp. KR3021 TaxID=114890 RepID=A0AC35TXW9_9BILA
MRSLTNIFLFLLFFKNAAFQLSKIQSDSEVLFDLINKKGYNPLVRPKGLIQNENGGFSPTLVKISIYVRYISNINEMSNEYSMQITFRQSWIDSRLRFDNNDTLFNPPNYFVLNKDDFLWKPDFFFANEISGHKHSIDQPNKLVRVYKDGTVLISQRISLVLSSPYNLINFPLDHQMIYLDIASYAHTIDDIHFEWYEESPIQMKTGINNSLPQFLIETYSTEHCQSITTLGNFSCLRLQFKLSRETEFYFFHIFIPQILLVLTSMVSFWLHPSGIPGRVTLGVTTLLTITTSANGGAGSKIHHVSYLRAIDFWNFINIFFIFCSLIEFAITSFLFNRTNKKSDDESNSLIESTEKNNVLNRRACSQNILDKFSGIQAIKIDYFSRIVFPILYFIFVITFFMYYGNERKHQ